MNEIIIKTEDNSVYIKLISFIKDFFSATIVCESEKDKSILDLSAKEEHEAMMLGAYLHNKKKSGKNFLSKHF